MYLKLKNLKNNPTLNNNNDNSSNNKAPRNKLPQNKFSTTCVLIMQKKIKNNSIII